MQIPPFLQSGDQVGIVAPARSIEQNLYAEILKIIEAQEFIPIRGKSTYLSHGPFAGTDAERAADLQSMLDNPEIKAIFCLRGGYGTVRIIEDLDFSMMQQQPKWLIGFSDITILHNQLHRLGLASLHGQMPLNFTGRTENKGLDTLFASLKGEALHYALKPHALNRGGEAEAELVGGNVAILSSLIGTPYDLDTDGKILFIEEVCEYLYRFDRLLYHLKLSGKLDKLKGLVVGGLSGMKDNDPGFGQSKEELVAALVQGCTYPVCFDFPAGHIPENYPLLLGCRAKLQVSAEAVSLQFC